MNLLGAYDQPWVTATAGAVVLTLHMLFLLGGYAAVMRNRTGRSVPEGEWRIWTTMYTSPSVQRYIRDAGEGGWEAYRLELWWDVVYSVLVGCAGVVLLDGLWGLYFGVDRWWTWALNLTPAFAAAADVLEDFSLLRATGPCPSDTNDLPHPGFVAPARWFTRAKFVLYAAMAGTLVVAAVALVVHGPPGR